MKLLIILLFSNLVWANESETPSNASKKIELPCDYTYEIANLIFKEKWNELAKYITFPIERDYPFPALEKQSFLDNPNLLFEKDMFKDGVKIKETAQGCMLNNGLLWANKTGDQKIFSINYETKMHKKMRTKMTSAQLAMLPQKLKNSKVMLSCVFNQNNYHVYKHIATGSYILLVANGTKVIKKIEKGSFKKDDTGIRYFQFQEQNAILSLADNIREGGYYLSLKTEEKEEKFYKCLGLVAGDK